MKIDIDHISPALPPLEAIKGPLPPPRTPLSGLIFTSMRQILLSLPLLAATTAAAEPLPATVDYMLLGRPLRLLLADSPEEWTRGLSGELPPGRYDGMLFRFPTSQPRKFWNRKTRVPLTLYWLEGDQVIGYARLPPERPGSSPITVSSPGPANGVVEVIEQPQAAAKLTTPLLRVGETP